MAIEKSLITAVLLSDGAWHDVANRSFQLVDYMMRRSDTLRERISGEQGSRWDHEMSPYGLPVVAFAFESPDGGWIKGPVTSVMAVKEADASEFGDEDTTDGEDGQEEPSEPVQPSPTGTAPAPSQEPAVVNPTAAG